jgi:hypothetical protein
MDPFKLSNLILIQGASVSEKASLGDNTRERPVVLTVMAYDKPDEHFTLPNQNSTEFLLSNPTGDSI